MSTLEDSFKGFYFLERSVALGIIIKFIEGGFP